MRNAIVLLLILLPVIGTPLLTLAVVHLYDARQQGERLGRYQNQSACVREVTRGRHVCTSWRCFLENRFYFNACMDRARPSPALCSDIESFGSLFELEAWKYARCRELGRVDRTCHHIWLRVLHACES